MGTIKTRDSNSSIHSAFSKMATLSESLTASILLYCFFLTLETIMAVTLIFGHYSMVAFMEILFASISLIVHTITVTVAELAAHRGIGKGESKRFGFKSWIETSIIVVDAVNLWLSVSVVTKNRNEDIQVLLIVALGGLTVFLYAVRIFHVFYTVLKPTTEKRKQQSRVSSIQGIFINRRFSEMQFCFEELFQKPFEEEIWSRAFSLQFYGTRETDESTAFRSDHSHLHNDLTSFHEGRPDWEDVFWKAIRKARQSDPDGESVGVFFCGSPAIAKCLRSTADKINAQLQFAAKRPDTKGRNHGNFKIVVHVENF